MSQWKIGSEKRSRQREQQTKRPRSANTFNVSKTYGSVQRQMLWLEQHEPREHGQRQSHRGRQV